MDKEDILKRAKDIFALAVENEKENRENSEDDIEFALLSKQWTEESIESRRKKNLPCLTINKLPTHIRQIVNDSRQNKPRIKVAPVDSNSDPETAEVITGLIRNIENTSKSDVATDNAIFNSVSSGVGYWRVNIDYAYDDTFEKDLIIDPIYNQFSVYGDPYSNSADSSDWNHCFVIDYLTKEDFKEKYKKDAIGGWEDLDGYSSLDAPWMDDDGIMIAEYWTREEEQKLICKLSDGTVIDNEIFEEQAEIYSLIGIQKVDERSIKSYKVTQYLMTGSEILETNEWPGKYIPIIPCYGEEVNLKGKRYLKSLIRDAKDAQRQFNFWITTATVSAQRSTKAPWLVKEGALPEYEINKWATSNAEDWAYLTWTGQVMPQQIPPAQMNASEMQMAMVSGDNIQSTMGMFNPSLGAQSNEISGKAIIARRVESDTGSFHFIDNLSRSIRHTGCILVDLIPHVYSGDRVVRVLGEDEKETASVQLGSGQNQIVNQAGDVVKIYDLSVGKYDVAVSAGMSYSTQRQEAANQMVELMRVNPAISQVIMGPLAKNLDWPGADEIAEKLGGENPELQQMQQQMQQVQQQAQATIQQLQEQIKQMQSDTAIKQAQLQIDAYKAESDKQAELIKLQIDAYKAESERLKVVQGGVSQQVAMQTEQNVMQTPDITPMTPITPMTQMTQQIPNEELNGYQ